MAVLHDECVRQLNSSSCDKQHAWLAVGCKMLVGEHVWSVAGDVNCKQTSHPHVLFHVARPTVPCR